MTINPDGSFFLEPGEHMPYICPKCFYPVPFDPAVSYIVCRRCRHRDVSYEFTTTPISKLT